MFRELTRINKKITLNEAIAVLQKETRGVLSVNGDDGYPYGMPMNHYYHSEDGCIYFHCGKGGHRMDAIRSSDKVSFCVYDAGYRVDDDWALNVKSVIVFGRIEVIDDMAQIIPITTALSHKFTLDDAYIRQEIESYAKSTLLLKLTPEHICGKLVKES
ncbi:MAG: pyridoxamine 5'-phosphate oxidase family protein [Clostridia bacterium]|nr:pyridoxamine 5'-phosphate oxidase family protein [Clostridia bacterium]